MATAPKKKVSSPAASSSPKPKPSPSPSAGQEIHLKIKPAKDPNAPATPAKKPAQAQSAAPSPAAQPVPKKPSKPMPKKPKAETKPPADVAEARARQTQVLKARQDREVGDGVLAGPVRDVNAAGANFWPPISPFL